MFLINVANPWILLIALFITLCFTYIGKEGKNAYVALVPLIVFLILLLMHGMQYMVFHLQYEDMGPILARCLLVDFIMIFLSYISYLWIDDIEAKAKKKKSIDDSLEWFWKKV